MERRYFLKQAGRAAAVGLMFNIFDISLSSSRTKINYSDNSLIVFSGLQDRLFDYRNIGKYGELLDICIRRDIPVLFVNYDDGSNIPRFLFDKLIDIPRVGFFPRDPEIFNSVPKSGKDEKEIVAGCMDFVFKEYKGSLEDKLDFNNLIVIGENIDEFDGIYDLSKFYVTCTELLKEKRPTNRYADYSFENLRQLLENHERKEFSNMNEGDYLKEGWGVAIVDMQEKYLDVEISSNQIAKLIKNMLAVLDYAKKYDIPILNFEVEGLGGGIDIFKPFVEPNNTYVRLDKNGFARVSREEVPDIEKLLVMGVYSDDCVAATIKGAYDFGIIPATSGDLIRSRYFNSLLTLQKLPDYTLYSSRYEDFFR